MTLKDIFAEGHRVAFALEQRRFAVRCEQEGGDEGSWLVTAESLPRVAYRKTVTPEDLGGLLGKDDLNADYWVPDETNCWCETCHTTRKLLETQDE